MQIKAVRTITITSYGRIHELCRKNYILIFAKCRNFFQTLPSRLGLYRTVRTFYSYSIHIRPNAKCTIRYNPSLGSYWFGVIIPLSCTDSEHPSCTVNGRRGSRTRGEWFISPVSLRRSALTDILSCHAPSFKNQPSPAHLHSSETCSLQIKSG